jgi:hypothetical protein
MTTCEISWNWGAWHQHSKKLFKTRSAKENTYYHEAFTSEEAAGMGGCLNIGRCETEKEEIQVLLSQEILLPK